MSTAKVVELKPLDPSDEHMARILHNFYAPPAPAIEVVDLERAVVEKVLADLEAGDPIALTADGRLVPYLRRMLAEPKRELWAMHSVGPGQIWPMLSKEHAEKHAKATQDRVAEVSRREGWSIGPVAINVIPSPYEPVEHFERFAEESERERVRFRQLAITRQGRIDDLLVAVAALLDENDATPAAIAAKQLLDKITKESA